MGSNPNRPSLSVTLFDSARQQVNRFLKAQGDPIRMTDGIRVRIGGRLATYPARSTLQLVMDRIDPAFTLGLLGQERTRLLAALTEEGLLRANADAALPRVPLHVGLVTSIGSAAHADALHELEVSDVGFRVSTFDARTQGADAPASIVAALHTAVAYGVDVVLLVRGGGAATDLIAFDHESVARTIANCGVAVFTGIGHETDRSVADDVAHSAHKTPTAAAHSIVKMVQDAERCIDDDWASIRSGVAGRLTRAADRLGRVGHRAGSAGLRRLDRSAELVDRRAARVAERSRANLEASAARVDAAVTAARPAASLVIERASSRLDLLAAQTRAADPAIAALRGWSITRRPDGRLLRSVHELAPGDELLTTLADGTVRSLVQRPDDHRPARGTTNDHGGPDV
jgi:exodeoxyribonuclease VII large subunit